MKVRVDLGLDFEGHHTLGWQPSESTGALEVPRGTLERWLAEREAFKVASLRWKRVIEEVEDQLYRAERERISPRVATREALTPRPPTRPRKSTELAAQLAAQVAERGPEQLAERGAERGAEQSAQRGAERGAEQSAQRGAERGAEQRAERGADQGAERAAEQRAECALPSGRRVVARHTKLR